MIACALQVTDANQLNQDSKSSNLLSDCLIMQARNRSRNLQVELVGGGISVQVAKSTEIQFLLGEQPGGRMESTEAVTRLLETRTIVCHDTSQSSHNETDIITFRFNYRLNKES